MLYIMSAQLFWDGNKRTANLAANAVLIRAGAGVLTVAESDIVEFNTLLTTYYDAGDAAGIKQFLYDKAIVDFQGQIADANVPANVPENNPLSAVEIKTLRAISRDPFATYDELARKIHRHRKTVQRAVAELKRRGIIARQGSSKKGFWQVAPEKL
jgi:predicted Rossmann fold nucleotide-binding protein DprA/Smf involved in DNA uptake